MCTTNTNIDQNEEKTEQVNLRVKSIWVDALKAKALHESVKQGHTVLYTDLMRDAIRHSYMFE